MGAAGAGFVTGAGTAACGPVQSGPEPEPLYDNHVRIGLLLPTSGGYEEIGQEIANGFRRFLTGNGNRLGGHPYVLHYADEGETEEDALAGLESLVEQRVDAIIGVVTATAMLAVGPAVEEMHIPLVGANASPVELPDLTYVWRTSYRNDEPGLALGGYLASEVNGPVAIVAPRDASGAEMVAGLRAALSDIGADDQLAEPILTAAESQPDSTFFAGALDRVAELEPAAVVAPYAGAAAVAFIRQYLDAGFAAKRLFGPADLTEGSVLDELGSNAVGIRTSANYAPELTGASNRSFAVAYRGEFARVPTTYAVAGHDAGAALDRAIRLTGGTPGSLQINRALDEIGLIDSPRGPWQFNQHHTPTQKWYLREVADDGPVLANVVVSELGTFG